MSEPQDHDETTAPDTTPDADPDADPGQLNPRDTRGTATGDGARAGRETGADADADPDGDPDALNPRSADAPGDS